MCFTPEIPLPSLFTGDIKVDNTLLANYIKALFVYFIWVVGVIAVVMIVYGGIRWVAAAGNPGRIKEARDIIDNAVIGVIIGLVSFVLLNTINPRLTKLSLPGVTNVATQDFCAGGAPPSFPDNFYVCQNETLGCGKTEQIDVKNETTGVTGKTTCMGTRCPMTSTQGNVCQFQLNASSNKFSGTCVSTVKYTGYDSLTTCNKIQGSVGVGSKDAVKSIKNGQHTELVGAVISQDGNYINSYCTDNSDPEANGFVLVNAQGQAYYAPGDTSQPKVNGDGFPNGKAYPRLLPRACPIVYTGNGSAKDYQMQVNWLTTQDVFQ